MSGPALGVYGILAMLVAMMVLRIPAGYAMALVGFLGMAVVKFVGNPALGPAGAFESALGFIGIEFWENFSKYEFTVIPMFILVGEIVYRAGYGDQLFHAAYTWVGHIRGGLAMATIIACAAFSAICGSNTATAATMSAVALPAMGRYKYHPILKAGAVAAGSTLGVMIPPSIVLVVYGLYTSQSIGKLFFGNVIPSVILATLMAVTVVFICKRHPEWGPRCEKTTRAEKIRVLPDVLDILFLFAVIMGALLSGVLTATEAAAISSLLALVICLLRRRLSWKGFQAAVYDTLRISCLVFVIVAGARIFGRFITATTLPLEIVDSISRLAWPHWAVMLVILACYIIGGCFMDALAFLLVSLPIFYPLVERMGYDLIWFGQIICVVTTLGAIMPPVGICCYVIAGMFKEIRIEQVFRGAMYYIPAYIITLILLGLFPYATVLILSNLAR